MQTSHNFFFADDCPQSPINSKRIGDKCYILGLTRLDLNAAQQYCLDRCGTLAEPNLTQNDIQTFSNRFHTQFADEIMTRI